MNGVIENVPHLQNLQPGAAGKKTQRQKWMTFSLGIDIRHFDMEREAQSNFFPNTVSRDHWCYTLLQGFDVNHHELMMLFCNGILWQQSLMENNVNLQPGFRLFPM